MFTLALTSLSIANVLGVSDSQGVGSLCKWNQKCANVFLIIIACYCLRKMSLKCTSKGGNALGA